MLDRTHIKFLNVYTSCSPKPLHWPFTPALTRLAVIYMLRTETSLCFRSVSPAAMLSGPERKGWIMGPWDLSQHGERRIEGDRRRESNREIFHFTKEWWRGNSEPSFPCLAPLAVADGTFMLERFVIAPGLLRPWSLGIWRAPSFLHNYALLWSLSHPSSLSFHNDTVSKSVSGERCGVY